MFSPEFSIPDGLADEIQLIWGMASEDPDDAFVRERIVPDGIVELVFHFGRPLLTYDAQGVGRVQEEAFAIS